MARMFSTASTANDMATRHPSDSHLRRRKNKSSSASATTLPSTPLQDRTNHHINKGSNPATPTGHTTSTFLPELHSTPPMPTFQKPSTPCRPHPHPHPPTDSTTTPPLQHQVTIHPTPISDPGRPLYSHPGTKVSPALVAGVEETPPLPAGWTQQHDRAICILDVRNYSLSNIVSKIRRAFPQLRGVLTTGMVDKRLRQLDQVVEIDYWKVGLMGAADGSGGGSGSGRPGIGGRGRSESRVTLGENVGVVSKAAEPAGSKSMPSNNIGATLVKSQSLVDMISSETPATPRLTPTEPGEQLKAMTYRPPPSAPPVQSGRLVRAA
ncbi:hypothetical protein BAUCODRAFT_482665 [Baudoinia panamericana UAMH 10762]|uniref:Uncharacterized protein n=1 Tax=Baudoinia panamericana (strain UAMH 10762) TaxID=717646 RepID=M2NCI7_BAUPA|nr:uncharacterized protein BAUCODRAFT_482665 [Baudoinia panamericana UAMH 10762]EMC96600.1 hypothetical protein BAUCODRAFT_482665 [Baudoinia panamericana UAMH 10762]